LAPVFLEEPAAATHEGLCTMQNQRYRMQIHAGRPMTTVADILKSKPIQTVHTIEAQASAVDAVKRMTQANVGALIVLKQGQVVGIISERDCARKLIPLARLANETPVHEIMSAPVLVVQPNRSSEDCMALMTENRLRHLPVMDDGQLIGMISIGDLVKQIVTDQKFVIEQLEHYISGDRF
jgi:CBS domain-containing protein